MEWMDEILDLRIEMLLREPSASMKDDDGTYGQALEQAEAVLKKLSMEDWETMDRFQNMVTEQEAKNSSYLYIWRFKGRNPGYEVYKRTVTERKPHHPNYGRWGFLSVFAFMTVGLFGIPPPPPKPPGVRHFTME